MNENLKQEYRDVRFRYSDPKLPKEFFIITAHNPDGETVDDDMNREANQQVAVAISDLGYPLISVVGGSPDFTHSEPGFGIACSREQALKLAQSFRQDAVFEIRGDRVFLISALSNPGPDEQIGSWKDLGEVAEPPEVQSD